MSIVYRFYCEKCGHEEEIYLGSGKFWYRKNYPQMISSAIDGEFGTEIQKTFKDHPNASVAYSKNLVKCGDCGRHENLIGLSVYLPKNDGFASGGKIINLLDIDKCYNRVATFEHKCKFCGGDVETFTEDTFDVEETPLQCPDCQSLMVGDWFGTWD